MPRLDSRLSVLHKYSTCKEYLATNQFSSIEFEGAQHVLQYLLYKE